MWPGTDWIVPWREVVVNQASFPRFSSTEAEMLSILLMELEAEEKGGLVGRGR
jgi:hypothetical protein